MNKSGTPILSYATPTPSRVDRRTVAVWWVALASGLAAAMLSWFVVVSAGYFVIIAAPACAAVASFTTACVARRARVRFGMLAAMVQFFGLLLFWVRPSSAALISISQVAYLVLLGAFFIAASALAAAMIVAISTLEPPPQSPCDRP